MNKQPKSLLAKDAELIWHPYTQHKNQGPILPITKAEGVYLIDEDGNAFIDAISSWWTTIHGHSHPYIAERIYKQALQLEHIIFAGCTHPPAVELAERLLPILPGNFSKIFYSDNGSTAVEVALKMAIQFWKNQPSVGDGKANSARKKILALNNSYHGDTFGAMSVSERGVFTMAFQDFLFEVIFIEPSTDITILENQWDQIACFIYEPLLQAAGGMNMYSATWLNELLDIALQNEVVCIADEVMTGFGRTGTLFASSTLQHKPDIICLSKGLTGGTLPLSISACTQKIFDAFVSDDKQKTFFHGHSYTANPIACAAALASLDLLQKEECKKSIEWIAEQNKEFVLKLKGIAEQENFNIKNIRSLGTVLAFEIDLEKNEYLSNLKEEIINFSLSRKIFLRPLGNTVYIMPPYCVTEKEMDLLFDLLQQIAKKF